MPLVNCGTILYPPSSELLPICLSTGYPIFSNSSNFTLNSTNTAQAYVFTVMKSGTVTDVAINIKAVTSAQDIQISIQTVDSSGNPSGANYGGSAPGTLAAGSVTVGVHDISLGTSATIVAGDTIAIVIEWSSTTGDIQPAVFTLQNGDMSGYTIRNSSGWTGKSISKICISLKYDDGTYSGPLVFLESTNTESFSGGSATSDEFGNKITIPFTCRCPGAYMICRSIGGGGGASINLSDSSSLIHSQSVDLDIIMPTSSRGPFLIPFSSGIELSNGGTYYISITTDSDSLVFDVPTQKAGGNAYLDTMSTGRNSYQVSRLNGGSWTENNERFFPIGLIIDQISDGSGVTPSEVASAVWTWANRTLTS